MGEQIILSWGLTDIGWNYFHMSPLLLHTTLTNKVGLGQTLVYYVLTLSRHATWEVGGMCTVHRRPSTVFSLNDWPTVKEMTVVRMLVYVLMDKLSPCWLISTEGLAAAVTAIFLSKTFTPVRPTSIASVTDVTKRKIPMVWVFKIQRSILFPSYINICYCVESTEDVRQLLHTQTASKFIRLFFFFFYKFRLPKSNKCKVFCIFN